MTNMAWYYVGMAWAKLLMYENTYYNSITNMLVNNVEKVACQVSLSTSTYVHFTPTKKVLFLDIDLPSITHINWW